MAKRKVKKAAKRRSSRRKSRSVKITKLPKEALTLVVILRAKEGQHLLLEAELRASSALLAEKKAAGNTTCTTPLISPACFCCTKCGNRANTTPNTPRRRISCAGTPARMRFSPPANPPSGSNWRRDRTLVAQAFRPAVCSRRGAAAVGAKTLTPGNGWATESCRHVK